MTDAAGADRRGAVRVLHGGEAHAPHQRAALLRQLRATGFAVGAFASREVFFLQLEEPLGRDEEQRLRGLLRLDPSRAEGVGAVPGELRLVVPRIGTISPWSSKASDILRQCGFAAVRRIERGVAYYLEPGWPARPPAALFDRMTQSLLVDEVRAADLFAPRHAPPLGTAAVTSRGLVALREADAQLGLALAADELEYLAERFAALGRDPTDTELMMFAQINSEHCRHKIFRADWLIDNTRCERSLFDMIRHTHASHPFGTLSAYHDNAAVIAGGDARWLQPAGARRSYAEQLGPRHIVMKVETHNHPTAIAPWPGASTGAGGEIRDEGATGRGARPKAGVCGFSVSNLEIPDFPRPWEIGYGRPDRIVSALQIMLDGPLGAAAFNNEFGRPNLGGYFRTMEAELGGKVWGYHKPIMIAGGVGSVAEPLVEKRRAQPGALVLQLGGPGLLIGLGGGAASSMQAGDNAEQLDFNSVQRDNPQMQRRCQEVIDRCAALGSDNPILSIHDVGAGGLSNAVPELVHDCGCGADLELRQVPLDDPGLSPMEIWCNEAQERYVLLVDADRLEEFLGYCEAERCPVAVLGKTTASQRLVVRDALFGNCPIDLDMDTLFGNAPKMTRRFAPEPLTPRPLPLEGIDFDEALERVLTFPAVADKSFLITIGDRSVGGLVCRDQFVGPDQVAVSDVAVTARDFHGHQGEAMAMGERTPVALLDPAAAARLAVTEAITNLAAAALRDRREIKLSANWMAAAGEPGQDAALYQAVEALGMTLCPALEVSVPVGKDSLSMKTRWRDEGMDKSVTAPVSLIVTAVAPVADVRATWTPELRPDRESRLMLVDLGAGKNRLGGSALAQVYGVSGQTPADLDEPRRLTDLLDLLARARSQQLVLASHDRSDGGLLVAALEMAFAGRCGVALYLDGAPDGCLPELFSEEPGVLLQVREADIERLRSLTIGTRLEGLLQEVGSITADAALSLQAAGVTVWSRPLAELRSLWSRTSFELQKLRDDPQCAQEEQAARVSGVPLLSGDLTFIPGPFVIRPGQNRPRVAILREQGVNGHVEMAAAFHYAGFEAVDLHMADLQAERASLADFRGIVACGGFSYGDVLGAGRGWAGSILYNTRLRDQFQHFFARPDTFGLGVCNGCQMFAQLRALIPGAQHWPDFLANRSGRFESRLVMARVEAGPSILFSGMAGSRIPVVVAHGEGRIAALDPAAQALVALRYVDGDHIAEAYPHNPNGSVGGATALTTPDGRFTIMMPHPERLFRSVQYSWCPPEWRTREQGPWFELFRNARDWVEAAG